MNLAEDVHPRKRDAAVAYLYEPETTMLDVAEDFGFSQQWVSQAVEEYRRAAK